MNLYIEFAIVRLYIGDGYLYNGERRKDGSIFRFFTAIPGGFARNPMNKRPAVFPNSRRADTVIQYQIQKQDNPFYQLDHVQISSLSAYASLK